MSTLIHAREELPAFRGRLIEPGDPEYEAARTVYNGMIDRRPALIARPAGADDVSRAIAFATQHGVPIAVRGGRPQRCRLESRCCQD